MSADPLSFARFIASKDASTPHSDLPVVMQALLASTTEIAADVRRAGLGDLLGRAGDVNVQGEEVQKLDRVSDDRLIESLGATGRICAIGTEERAEMVTPENAGGEMCAVFDPLDGSSNIDVGAPIGTIFGLLRRRSGAGPAALDDLLQPGRQLLAAGYVLYGSSTMLVYSQGSGVHAFTLDPVTGEYIRHAGPMMHPEKSRIYSINEANRCWWHTPVRRWVDGMQKEGSRTARYIGSLVADFHRNLIRGGVFSYPSDTKDAGKPHGKLRLLYEAAPLAFLAEQSGGAASDGRRPILDITPDSLHQRIPLFIGNRADVAAVDALHAG